MWEGRKLLPDVRGLSQWNHIWRFGFVSLPLFFALIGLIGLFGLVDIKQSSALSTTRYVTEDGTGVVCTIGSPCALQTAVTQSQPGDEVLVAAGTYITTANPILLITETITITGGYDNGNWSLLPDPQNNQTILDGQNSAQVISIEGPVNPIIDGFEIRNGSASQGAGIYVEMGEPLIRNNQIYNNVGSGVGSVGAGIYDNGSATIVNNSIYKNQAGSHGGGIYVDSGNGLTTISFNEIYSNSVGSSGGGILVQFNAKAFIEGNSIYNNNAADSGAGFGSFGTTSTTLQNNMLYNNEASSLGGGILAVGTLNIWNNTVAANSAGNGGGIYADAGATVQISNTIVVSNTGAGITGIRDAGATISGDFNNIFGNDSDPTFTTTISTDPKFINFDTFNLHLSADSPNKDAGDPNTPASINIDIDKQVRPNPSGTQVDIGADEFYPNIYEFTFTPGNTDVIVDRNTNGVVFTHTLDNIGTIVDSYTFDCSNDLGWTIDTCPDDVLVLESGEQVNVNTIIDVPDVAGLTLGTTYITVTSLASSTLSDTVRVLSTVAPQPNVTFTPNYTATLLPDTQITFTHRITNTGDSPDTFSIVIDSDPNNWAQIIPAGPYSLPLNIGASADVLVRITVPPDPAAGVFNTAVIRATSDFDPQISATVINTVTAKSTVGTRYVFADSDDNIDHDKDNNCTQSSKPCESINQAVAQAANFDEVRIQSGNYVEADEVTVNATIYLSGGWNSNFRSQGGPEDTVITVSNGRFFNIDEATIQPTISNLTLDGGRGANKGGAIYINRYSQPELTSLILQNNETGSGGAIYVEPSTNVTISNTHFLTNTATDSQGGAIFVDNGIVTIQKSSFINNEATLQDGGAIYLNGGATSTSINNLFHNNRAGGDGGAVFADTGRIDDLHNTYVANEAGASGIGGAVYNNAANLSIDSSIIVSNTANSFAGVYVFDGGVTAKIEYSDLWNNSTTPDTNVSDYTNNISADPLFADDLFHLGLGSPAIDTSNPDSTQAEDFEEDFRPSDQGYDMGYDELPGCLAKRDGEIFGSIQAAIDMPGATGDMIQVSGICRGVNTIVVNNETISQTVHLTETVTIQGGWNSNFSKRTFAQTIIDPEGNGRGIFISGGSSVQPTIETITIMNGDASDLGGGAADADAGGNIYNLDASPELIGVEVMSGTAVLGGGLYNYGGTFSVTAYFPSGNSPVIPTDMVSNTATSGGAVYVGDGLVVINASEIHDNTAVNGAGLYANSGTLTVTNAILANNNASNDGGAFYNDSDTTYVLHTTVYSNTATNDGGGIYNNASGSPMIRNNIFESNQATNGPAIFSVPGAPDFDFNYYYDQTNPVSGASIGANSVNSPTPPGLLDPANNDFHLAEGAPAIDIGDPDSPVTADYEDDPRPSNQSTDMGADEVAGCRVRLNGVFYGSIQAAIANATNGDILDVSGTCSGVHEYATGQGTGSCRGDNGTIFTTIHIDKDVTLRGGWNESFSSQNSVTTLDALSLGRVIYIAKDAAPTIENFEIIQGLLTGTNANGAGICIDEGASPTILNNTIYSNTATNGAAIYSVDSTPTIKEGNRIYSNTATANGGGLFIEASSAAYTATIQNNFVYSNTAVSGGAIYNDSGTNYFWHNTIVGNQATTGGAFYVNTGQPEIRSNLIISNSATNIGGGAFGANTPTAILAYNNFFGQTGGNFGGTIGSGGTGSQTLDPGFVDETYEISIESPVVDLGDPTMPITEDFEADIRPSHQGFDIGADEIGGCFAYISPDSATVYGSLQQAIDLANEGDTINVKGTCYGTNTRSDFINTDVTQNTFISKNLTINGNWASSYATLDALGNGRVVYIDFDKTVTLTKIILTNGNAAGAGYDNKGGGIYNTGTLVLDQVKVISNTATDGGGIYNTANITLDNSTLEENTATDGAGLYNAPGAGSATITNETMFQHNNAASNGGAIYQNDGDLTLDGNNLFDNIAGNEGGGIYLTGAIANDIDIYNNFIIRNRATTGGGIFNANTHVHILHNTIYSNTASGGDGGGVASPNSPTTPPKIRNNIVDSNTGSGIHASSGTDADFNLVANNTGGSYSGGVSVGASDIISSPTYLDIGDDDYHLTDNSAGVDVADPLSPLALDHDYDGHLRPTNGGPDIGADEINSCLIRVIPPLGDPEIFGVLQKAINRAEEFNPPPDIEVARGQCTGVQSENGTLQLGYITKDLNFIGSLRRVNFSDPNDYDNDDVGTISSIFNAAEEGRVIVIGNSTAKVSFTHIAFINGNAAAAGDTNNNGGAIYNPGAEVSFSEVFLCDSEADNGAGYYGGPGSVADATGTSFGRCTVAYVTESSGGSVVPYPATYWKSFLGNDATNNGGGFYSDGRFDMRNVGFRGNSANHGAGIYNTENNNRIINGTHYQNSATSNGGAIYHNGSNLEIYHNTFVDNSAGGDGGAIWHNDSNLVLNSSILSENTASGDGGGLSSNSGTLAYNNFYNNSPNPRPNGTTGANATPGDPKLSVTTLYDPESPVIDKADPGLLDPGVLGPPPFSDQVIDYDRGMFIRPDGEPNHNGLHGKGSDIGSDEYLKDFGCLITPASDKVTTNPDTVITYTFEIQNFGREHAPWDWRGYTDTISITLQSSQGWGSLQNGDEAIVLGWKESVTRTITVVVPPDAQQQTKDVSTIKCESASMPSRTDTGTATTSVGLVASIIVIPDYQDTAAPGDVITYVHQVINQGNAPGRFLLTPSPGPQHANADIVDDVGTVLTNTIIELDQNEIYTVNLRVNIKSTAAANDFAKPQLIATEVDDDDKIIIFDDGKSNSGAALNEIEILHAPGLRHVSASGAANTTNCTDPTTPCATIQYALDQSVNDDTILISGGTYTDTITRTFGADVADQVAYIDKSITIRGGYNANFTSYEPITNAVTLDGEDLRRVFFITDGITVTISSLFIENGTSHLQDIAPTQGGAIYNNGALLTITGTWFISNTAQFGGALYHQSANMLINSSVFADNGTNQGGGQGGAIHLDSGSTDIINNTFANNALLNAGSPEGEGGAIYAGSGSLELYNNIFANNQGSSGAQAVITQSVVTLINDYNLFTNSFNQINFTEGPNSLVGDPAFGDAFYHITTNSDAKDSGADTWLASGNIDFELDARPQPQGGVVDIGADERVQKPGFLFEPITQTAEINPSDIFTYTHTITNTGDEDDSYTITMTNQSIPPGGGFAYSLSPTQTQVISPGDTIQVTFEITGGLAGYVDQTVITATSNTGISQQVVDTTTISQTAGVDIELSESGIGSPGQAIEYSHVLTNTGDGIDSFTIAPITTTAVPTSWVVTVNPTQTGILNSDESLPFTVTVNVPAGTLSDTVHTVEIEAVSAASPLTSDVLTDTTTVGADFGLTLTPDNSSTSPDNTQVVYTHTLQNIGNLVDTVLITPTSSLSWTVDVQPTPVILQPLETQTVVVTVTVPANTGGLTHTAVITAESQGGYQVTAVNTTTVDILPGVLLESDSLIIDDPGDAVTHTFTLTNTGNITDSYDITFVSSAGWITDTTPSPIQVAPGMTKTVTATGTIDAGAVPPDADSTVITATSQITSTVFDLVTATTRVRQIHGLLFAPDNATTTPSNRTVTYTHVLTNTGNGPDTFSISANSSRGWVVTTTNPLITVGSGISTNIVVSLTVPIGGSGLTDTMHVTATSTISSSTSAMVTNTTTVSGIPGTITVTISPDNIGTGLPGSLVTYTHQVKNTGTITESFSIDAVSDSGWITAVSTDTLTLTQSESASVVVTVTIPVTATNSIMDVVTVTARSNTEPAKFDTATDTTTAGQTFGVLLEPDNAGIADANTVLTYSHVVTNTGNGTDTFSFAASNSNGWGTAVPADITLGADLTQTIVVSLTIPSGATGVQDTMVVTATSTTDSTATDSATNTTRVNGTLANLGIDIAPNGSASAAAGTTVQYVHTITNTGDTTDDYTITAVSTQSWAVVISTEQITLAAGETTDISVRVTVPGTAVPGTVDRTTVTVTSASNNAISDAATDTTTVEEGVISIYLPFIANGNASSPIPTPTPITPTPTPATCSPTGVDLIVTEIRVEPFVPIAGETATVFVTLRNQGSTNVAYGNNFFLDLYDNRVPATLVAGDLSWGVQGDDLNAGTSKTYTASYIFTGGNHQLYAQADTDNTVNECPNENNNTLGPISLIVSGTFVNNGSLNQIDSDEPRETPTPAPPISSTLSLSTPTSSASTSTSSASTSTPTTIPTEEE